MRTAAGACLTSPANLLDARARHRLQIEALTEVMDGRRPVPDQVGVEGRRAWSPAGGTLRMQHSMEPIAVRLASPPPRPLRGAVAR